MIMQLNSLINRFFSRVPPKKGRTSKKVSKIAFFFISSHAKCKFAPYIY